MGAHLWGWTLGPYESWLSLGAVGTHACAFPLNGFTKCTFSMQDFHKGYYYYQVSCIYLQEHLL